MVRQLRRGKIHNSARGAETAASVIARLVKYKFDNFVFFSYLPRDRFKRRQRERERETGWWKKQENKGRGEIGRFPAQGIDHQVQKLD